MMSAEVSAGTNHDSAQAPMPVSGTLDASQASPNNGQNERLISLGVHERLQLERESWLRQELLDDRGIDVVRCLECGKCCGGCSTGYMFDYTPRQIVQLVKLDALDTLLRMDSLSMCVGCELCTDRCPVGIDGAGIIDYFRERACRQGIAAPRTRVSLFNELFLGAVRSRGRISELPLMLRFNIKTSRYLQDASLGLKLLRKGKLRLHCSRVKNRRALAYLFGEEPRCGRFNQSERQQG